MCGSREGSRPRKCPWEADVGPQLELSGAEGASAAHRVPVAVEAGCPPGRDAPGKFPAVEAGWRWTAGSSGPSAPGSKTPRGTVRSQQWRGGHKVIVWAPERVHCPESGVDGSDGCPGSQLDHQEPTSPPGSLGAYLCCRRLHAILCPNGPLSLQPLDAPLFVPR